MDGRSQHPGGSRVVYQGVEEHTWGILTVVKLGLLKKNTNVGSATCQRAQFNEELFLLLFYKGLCLH